MDTDAGPDGGNSNTGDTGDDRERAGSAPTGQPAAQPASGTVLVAFSNPDEFVQVRTAIRRAAEAAGIEVRAGGHLPSAGEGQP